jgi:hypothetical protein
MAGHAVDVAALQDLHGSKPAASTAPADHA